MKTIYLPEKPKPRGWDKEAKAHEMLSEKGKTIEEMEGRQRLAQRMRTQRRIDFALGKALWRAKFGEDPQIAPVRSIRPTRSRTVTVEVIRVTVTDLEW